MVNLAGGAEWNETGGCYLVPCAREAHPLTGQAQVTHSVVCPKCNPVDFRACRRQAGALRAEEMTWEERNGLDGREASIPGALPGQLYLTLGGGAYIPVPEHAMAAGGSPMKPITPVVSPITATRPQPHAAAPQQQPSITQAAPAPSPPPPKVEKWTRPPPGERVRSPAAAPLPEPDLPPHHCRSASAASSTKSQGRRRRASEAPCSEEAQSVDPGWEARYPLHRCPAEERWALVGATRMGLVREMRRHCRRPGKNFTQSSFTEYLRQAARMEDPKQRVVVWQRLLVNIHGAAAFVKNEASNVEVIRTLPIAVEELVAEVTRHVTPPEGRRAFLESCFHVFDPDRSGYISRAVISFRGRGGGALLGHPARVILRQLFVEHPGTHEVDYPAFCTWMTHEPALLCAFAQQLFLCVGDAGALPPKTKQERPSVASYLPNAFILPPPTDGVPAAHVT